VPSVPELWRANRHQNHWPGVRGSGGSLETHLRIAGPISSFAAGVHPAANDLVGAPFCQSTLRPALGSGSALPFDDQAVSGTSA